MPLSAGTRLGRDEVVSFLSAGGMGEVYRARDTRLDRWVAIKILPTSFASDPDRLRRFEHEARAVATLNHPNILFQAAWPVVPEVPRTGCTLCKFRCRNTFNKRGDRAALYHGS